MSIYISGLLAVIVAIIPVYFLCGNDVAMIFSVTGTICFQIITLIYIVLFDSRKRWPNVGTFHRFARVMTFYRGK